MENGKHRIQIAGDWSLEDLYVFPRAYEQCYFMYLGILADGTESDDERIARAYEVFPWQGGYSAVDFYDQLKFAVPRNKRPRINCIEYASPGFIELSLAVMVALTIERVVRSLCNSELNINDTYTHIYKDLQERKLLKIKTENEIRELTRSERDILESHANTLSSALGID